MSEWISVQSTSLSRVRWDDSSSTLQVEFLGGDVYEYEEVPEHVFKELLGADSIGKYFARNIRKKYRYSQIKN